MHVADDLFTVGEGIPIWDGLIVGGKAATEQGGKKKGREEELFHFGGNEGGSRREPVVSFNRLCRGLFGRVEGDLQKTGSTGEARGTGFEIGLNGTVF
jgi:hypothetical protein